jgi:hypothetical protein
MIDVSNFLDHGVVQGNTIEFASNHAWPRREAR